MITKCLIPSKESKIKMRKLLAFCSQELPDSIIINDDQGESVEITVTYQIPRELVQSLNELLA